MSPYIVPGLPINRRIDKDISVRILEIVSEYYRVSLADMKQKSRFRNVVLPRQISMWCLKYGTKLTLNDIGAIFGSRDHTTVIHSVNKIDNVAEVDEDFRKELQGLIKKIESDVITGLSGKHINSRRRSFREA